MVIAGLFLLLIPGIPSFAQLENENPGFLKGYALNGKDTIRCRLAFNHPFPYPDNVNHITLDLDGEVMTFEARDRLITGFGVKDGGRWIEYGLIMDPSRLPAIAGSYVKKIVPGPIDLFEIVSNTRITNTSSRTAASSTITTSNAPLMTNNAALTKSNSSLPAYSTKKTYFIGKTDTTTDAFINPTRLPSLKKKYIAPFFADYPDLQESIPEKMNKKKLIRFVKEYNYWWQRKTKNPGN